MNERNKIMSRVVKNLEQVYDPEMPSVSVIHLGLIYDIEILEDNTVVKITHTLTSAFCPMADEINQNIQQTLEFGKEKLQSVSKYIRIRSLTLLKWSQNESLLTQVIERKSK